MAITYIGGLQTVAGTRSATDPVVPDALHADPMEAAFHMGAPQGATGQRHPVLLGCLCSAPQLFRTGARRFAILLWKRQLDGVAAFVLFDA